MRVASSLVVRHCLNVKPQKGRRRDLKELDRLISKLSDLASNW